MVGQFVVTKIILKVGGMIGWKQTVTKLSKCHHRVWSWTTFTRSCWRSHIRKATFSLNFFNHKYGAGWWTILSLLEKLEWLTTRGIAVSGVHTSRSPRNRKSLIIWGNGTFYHLLPSIAMFFTMISRLSSISTVSFCRACCHFPSLC